MGRKAKFTEGVIAKKGPGRKAKKQKDPIIKGEFNGLYLISLKFLLINLNGIKINYVFFFFFFQKNNQIKS